MAQRQFAQGDTDKWLYGFGTGAGGNFSSGGSLSAGGTTNTYWTTIAGTAGATSATLGGAWTWDGPCFIKQERGTGVGNWELNWITVSSSTSATFKHALMNTYTTSGASVAQIITMFFWDNFTLNTGHTLTIPTWNGGGLGFLPIIAKNTISIVGSINGTGVGFLGGSQNATSGNLAGYQGEGSGGARNTNSVAANGNGGGGGGANNSSYVTGGGGGGGGHASTGGTGNGAGNGGSATGNAALTVMTFGGGGGGGGNDDAAGYPGSAGGNGGGGVLLIAQNISLSGSILVNGNNGSNYANQYGGTGGGGAGGAVLLKCKTATLGTNLITATGGSGGNRYEGGIGGTGSVGRIHLDYKTSYTGTTNPTLDYVQDLTLDYPPSSNFFAFFS